MPILKDLATKFTANRGVIVRKTIIVLGTAAGLAIANAALNALSRSEDVDINVEGDLIIEAPSDNTEDPTE